MHTHARMNTHTHTTNHCCHTSVPWPGHGSPEFAYTVDVHITAAFTWIHHKSSLFSKGSLYTHCSVPPLLLLASASTAGHQFYLSPRLSRLASTLTLLPVASNDGHKYLSFPSHWLSMQPPMTSPTLPSAINAGHQYNLSRPSNWLSMLATTATINSPPISYQCWPPLLPLTHLPSAINAGHQCYLSLPSHRLVMLATMATSHSPPISYQ